MIQDKILNQYIEKFAIENGINKEQAFNFLSIKNIDKGMDEISMEITDVDGSQDVGIDNVIFKQDGRLIESEKELDLELFGCSFEITLVQIKYSESLKEEHLNKFFDGIKYFLGDINKNANDDVNKYKKILEKILDNYSKVSPQITFNASYVTKAPRKKFEENNNIQLILKNINEYFKEKQKSGIYNESSNFNYISSEELLIGIKKIIENNPDEQELAYTEIIKSVGSLKFNSDSDYDSFIILVEFIELFNLVKNNLDNIYLENVRHFINGSNVNKGISNRINNIEEMMDFWIFNNGLTLLADSVKNLDAKNKLLLKNPKIIDGLQTSFSIYSILKKMTDDEIKSISKRKILIKIISTDNNEVKIDVIKSNNDRNKVSSVNFLSIDEEQKYIENEFEKHGYYYDRIMNMYANKGKEIDKIIKPIDLSIAYTTLILGLPSKAKNSKLTLISNEKNKNAIFKKPEDKIYLYLNSHQLFKAIQKSLNVYQTKNGKYLNSNSTENTMLIKKHKFHISVLILKELQNGEFKPNELNKKININQLSEKINDNLIKKAISNQIKYLKLNEVKISDYDKFIKNPSNDKKFEQFLKN